MDITSELRRVRERHGLTQGELAGELGVSRQSVIAVESGKYRPSIHLALLIAEFFELPVEYIFRCDVPEEQKEKKKPTLMQKGGEVTMDRDLMPWSPWREMINMRDTIDRLFDDSLVAFSRPGETVYPAINVHQTDRDVIVEADLPGMKEDGIEIEVGETAIAIKGERRRADEVKKENYYHKEVSYGSFGRVVNLPVEIDPSRATAKFEHGTLTVTLPKREAKQSKVVKLKPKSSKEIK